MKVTMAAGKYVLGDPCYCFGNGKESDDLWQKLLENCEYFEKPIGEINGVKILGFSTAHGDGTYQGTNGFEYPVDAGLIGLVPFDFAISQVEEIDEALHNVVEFSEDFECSNYNGVMVFGEIHIDTLCDDTSDFDDDEDFEDYP